jgi:hypothetical protein
MLTVIVVGQNGPQSPWFLISLRHRTSLLR